MGWEESVMSKQYIELSEIIKEMREVRIRLNISAKEVFNLARAKAEAERKYRIALRQEKLKLREQGLAATLIDDLAKGEESIAQLRFERDIAKELYVGGLESMKQTRTEASLLQTISKYQDEL
jgi:alpha-amylase/alpha-mannosidase (GH57 family)